MNARTFAQFVTDIQRDVPTATIADCEKFCKVARSAQRINETRCNRDLTAAEDARDDRNDAQAQEIADKWGVVLECNGDPRGYPYRVILPSRRSNSFSGNGYGIPCD